MNFAQQKNKIVSKDVYMIILHVIIGLIAVIFPLFIPILIIGVVFSYLFIYSRNDENKLQTLLFISYISGLETIYRASGEFFLPYEISKYVQIVFVLLNLFIVRTRFNSFVGILLLILMLPSLILFPADNYKYFVFNTLGLCSLAFLIAFTAYQKISFADFTRILKTFLYPCISFVTLITIKTPDFSDIEFSLGANFETTGGFGANQVATLLGAAICFLIILTDQKRYLGNRLITIGFIIYFTLRALLSFSRGGVLGMVIALGLAFILFKKIKQKNLVRLALIILALTAVFVITNEMTDGLLLLRYQGETTGTLSGSKDKSIEGLSSGRSSYAEVDMAQFFNNIFLGVGPGNSQFLRYKYGLYDESAPHTEATRLLAENGIFGVLINIILVVWPIYIVYKTKGMELRFIKSTLFIFAYATTFHSAMRTGLTPLFYGLASMNIVPDNFFGDENITEKEEPKVLQSVNEAVI